MEPHPGPVPNIEPDHAPLCLIIAGANGVGKTTFAREFLPNEAQIRHFINADLLAAGLSPLDPDRAKIAAGRLFLHELDRLAAARESFCFESTLSGLGYLPKLRAWKAAGYRLRIIYLKVDSPSINLQRIQERVVQGGHFVPDADMVRRFERSWKNFENHYAPLANTWSVYDNTKLPAVLIKQTMINLKTKSEPLPIDRLALPALERAAQQARKLARMYGTKIHTMRDGKLVAEEP